MSTNEICPSCGKELRIRTNRASQEQFFGCSGFPNCRFSKAITNQTKIAKVERVRRWYEDPEEKKRRNARVKRDNEIAVKAHKIVSDRKKMNEFEKIKVDRLLEPPVPNRL